MNEIKHIVLSVLASRHKNSGAANGYVQSIDANLLPGVKSEQFADELIDGDGNELDSKFMAIHSSSALAVNCFAWFNEPIRLNQISILEDLGAREIRFERKFPVFARGKAPNLDVVVVRDSELIAIESKFTEHLCKTKPKFSPSYDKLAPPELAEPSWWAVYQQAKAGQPQYLDIAQLVKHYFGLRSHQLKSDSKRPIRLLYLFWEPLNADEIEACRQHRRECESLAQTTATSSIPFQWMTYIDLWNSWLDDPPIADHARNLLDRYGIKIPWTPDCKKCGQQLVQRILHVVTGKCWNCGSDMPIAFVDCGGIVFSPEEMTEAEKAKAEELSTHLQNRFSHTRGERYCANTCPTCRAMTGSHYLHDFNHLVDAENGYPMGLSCLDCEDQQKMDEENEAEKL